LSDLVAAGFGYAYGFVTGMCFDLSGSEKNLLTDNIQISEDGAQEVITEAQDNAAKVDAGSTTGGTSTGGTSGENNDVVVTVPSTEEQSNEAGKALESSQGNVSDRPLILYAYADSKDGSALENLKFFIAHGLHAAADFVFILNGETDAKAIIPAKDNIRLVQRPNECYDLGAYSEVLLKDDLYKNYKRFITLNASVRGPFIPYWSEGCWTEMFLSKVTDEVKVNTTIPLFYSNKKGPCS